MSSNGLQAVLKQIDSCRTEAVDLMKAIVPIKALGPTNDGVGEWEKAAFLIEYLTTIGFKVVEEYPASDPLVKGGLRPNLIARIAGEKSDRTVWILAHLDVVPEGDRSKWDTEPFEAVVKDGRIYGRGTEDNNQGLVSGVLMAKAFIESGVKPLYNIGLVMVADEETGSKYGLEFLMDNHRDIFSKDDLFIVPDAGEPDSSMIEVAEKSIMWVKFKTVGKQVHASLPAKGINAFKAASNLAVALDQLHELFGDKDPVFDPPISTFEPTKKEANVPNVNTIPGEDIFYLDCRILPQYDIADVMLKIKEICLNIEEKFKVKIEISTEQEEQAAPATAVDAPVVRTLESAIKAVYDIKAVPMGIGGGTVAAIFRRAGFDAAVWATLDDLAHQPNEYCVIDNMINDAKVFAHVCMTEV
jgi:succinyl-diaminopimelate desuccinylase